MNMPTKRLSATALSPTWQTADGSIKLFLGDCLDILPTLEAGSVDAVVTDPPYGVEFAGKSTKHTRAAHQFSGGYVGGDSDVGLAGVAEALRVSKRGVVFPGNRLMFRYPEPYDVGCVYCPSGAGLGRWGFVVFHPILFYGMAKPHGRQGPSGFSSFATVEDNGHPCPKPLSWMEWAVKKSTEANELVCDPFLGSGTTAIACSKLSRRFIGIEKEPKYFEIAVRRIEAELNRAPLFEKPPVIQRTLEACA